MAASSKRGTAPSQADFHAAISSRSDRWYAACLRITRNPALAEDAVQDALVSAWSKRHQFRETARLDTWIQRIAINSALMLIRKQRPGRFTPLDHDVADEADLPVTYLEQLDVQSSLGRACAQLSEIERVCFLLKHIEEWRLKEIAAALDTSIGTVKQAVFRAVKKLRTQMTDLQRSEA